MGERAAAAGAVDDDDVDAVARQQPDRRLVDLGRDHLLHAAREQRNTLPTRALRAEDLRPVDRGRRRDRARRQREHGSQARGQQRRQRLRHSGAEEGQAEEAGARQQGGEQAAQPAVEQRAAVGLLDVPAGVVDEVHVVHARGAGGHAGKAGEAAVNVLHHLGRCRAGILQHVLDQVDAAARAVELVAEQHIGRAGRGAEAAMHAGAQDPLGLGDVGIGQLCEGKGGLHAIRDRFPSLCRHRISARIGGVQGPGVCILEHTPVA
jgi:hypothetical protein